MWCCKRSWKSKIIIGGSFTFWLHLKKCNLNPILYQYTWIFERMGPFEHKDWHLNQGFLNHILKTYLNKGMGTIIQIGLAIHTWANYVFVTNTSSLHIWWHHCTPICFRPYNLKGGWFGFGHMSPHIPSSFLSWCNVDDVCCAKHNFIDNCISCSIYSSLSPKYALV